MQGRIVVGIILVLLGFFHILRPHKVSEVIKKVYKDNPFLKNERQRVARPKFIVIFGILWILVGLSVLIFGP